MLRGSRTIHKVWQTLSDGLACPARLRMPRRKELSLRGQSEKAGPRYSPRVDGQPRGGRWTAAGRRGERARGARARAGGPSCPGPSLCSTSSPLRKPAPRAPRRPGRGASGRPQHRGAAPRPRLTSAPACRGPHAPPTVSERHSAAERLAGGCLAHRRPLGSTSWSDARSAARPRGFAPLRFRAGCPCLPTAPGSVPSSQDLTPSLPQPPTPVLSGLETTRQNYSVFATEVLRGTC